MLPTEDLKPCREALERMLRFYSPSLRSRDCGILPLLVFLSEAEGIIQKVLAGPQKTNEHVH